MDCRLWTIRCQTTRSMSPSILQLSQESSRKRRRSSSASPRTHGAASSVRLKRRRGPQVAHLRFPTCRILPLAGAARVAHGLSQIALLRQPRLAVMPLTPAELGAHSRTRPRGGNFYLRRSVRILAPETKPWKIWLQLRGLGIGHEERRLAAAFI